MHIISYPRAPTPTNSLLYVMGGVIQYWIIDYVIGRIATDSAGKRHSLAAQDCISYCGQTAFAFLCILHGSCSGNQCQLTFCGNWILSGVSARAGAVELFKPFCTDFGRNSVCACSASLCAYSAPLCAYSASLCAYGASLCANGASLCAGRAVGAKGVSAEISAEGTRCMRKGGRCRRKGSFCRNQCRRVLQQT